MTRQSISRKRRRARGLCAWDGCPVSTGDVSYLCLTHKQSQAVYDLVRRRKRRTAKLAVAS